MQVAGDGGGVSPAALVHPLLGAVSSASQPEASPAPARSSHGATSGAEQPEASVANPMPNILGGMSSSSEEGVEVDLRHAPPAPAIASPPPTLEAIDGQPEAMLAEQAPAARSSFSPLPVEPRGGGEVAFWSFAT